MKSKKNMMLVVAYALNKGVDKYLSPVSGAITTRLSPFLKSFAATFKAAHVAAPEEIPTKIPSIFAKFLQASAALSKFT